MGSPAVLLLQVSMKYLRLGLNSTVLTSRQKFAVAFLLLWRELYPYFTFHPILIMIVYTARQGAVSGVMLTASTLFCAFMMLVKLVMVYGLANGTVAERGTTSEFLLYAALNLPYKTALNTVHVMAHAQQFLAIDNWVTTPRTTAASKGGLAMTGEPQKPPKAPSAVAPCKPDAAPQPWRIATGTSTGYRSPSFRVSKLGAEMV
jgi:hypothetical protein